jgi:hypothetical protein
MSHQQFVMAMSSDPARGAVRMSCGDVRCAAQRDGWLTTLDPEDGKHVAMMRWIEGDSGRKFFKLHSEDAAEWVARYGATKGITDHAGTLAGILQRTPPGLVSYLFPPGQQCFRPHIDREVTFSHVTPRSNYVHATPKDWEEDMEETADAVGVLERSV